MQPRFEISDEESFDNIKFLKTVGTLGVPTVLQQLLSTGLNMLDTLMVGRLGEISVAAVAVANKLVFVYSLVIFGLCSGLSIFTAQFFGAGEYKKIGKLSGFMYLCVSLFAFLFTIGFMIFAPQLITLFVKDEPAVVASVVEKGAEYLRIIALSTWFMGMSFAISSLCRGIRRTKYPLYAVTVSVLTNTLLNFLLIYGKGGFPRLETKGAAIATLIARMLEFALMILIVYSPKSDNPIKIGIKNIFKWEQGFTKKLIKTAYPVVINETLWSLGQTYYVAIIGMLGAASLAVIQITSTVNGMFFAVFQGVSVACSVMVGNAIGAGQFVTAKRYANRFLLMSLGVSLICGGALAVLKGPIISLYTLEESTVPLLYKAMNATALTMGCGMLNTIFIVGLFRSGGDTKFCMWEEGLVLWLVGIPVMYVAVKHFSVPVYIAAALLQTDNMVKIFISFFRFKSGKWMHRVIGENSVNID